MRISADDVIETTVDPAEDCLENEMRPRSSGHWTSDSENESKEDRLSKEAGPTEVLKPEGNGGGKMMEFKPEWFEESIESVKEEIKVEVTQAVISRLVSALNNMGAEVERGTRSERYAGATEPPKARELPKKAEEPAAGPKPVPIIHYNIICDNCEHQVEGVRYKCNTCPDFDLCEACESIPGAHNENHTFTKIRKPLLPNPFQAGDVVISLDLDLDELQRKGALGNNGASGSCTYQVVGNRVQPTNATLPEECADLLAKCTLEEPSVRPKHVVKRVAELTKKVDKLRVKSQAIQRQVGEAGYDSSSDGKRWTRSDRTHGPKLIFLGGTLVSEETVPEGPGVEPGTVFKKFWRVRNTGTKSWNSKTTLKYCWGNAELETLNKSKEFPVPPLKPGQEGRISIKFAVAKACAFGLYHSHWRLHHRGQPFGQRLVCKVYVEANDSKCFSACRYDDLLKCDPAREQFSAGQMNFSCTSDKIKAALSTVQEDKFGGENDTKSDVISHTATPTNTPFNVSPPKSPEPRKPSGSLKSVENSCTQTTTDLEQKVQTSSTGSNTMVVVDMNAKEILATEDSNLSSSESSDEFVVVPLPRCFDLSEPFNVDILGSVQKEPSSKAYDDVVVNNSTDVSVVNDLVMLHSEEHQVTANGNLSESSTSNAIESEAPCTPTAPITNDVQPKNEETPRPPEPIPASSTNPFAPQPETGHQSCQPVIPESLVNGALHAAAHVVQNVSRALFSLQRTNSIEDFSWITAPAKNAQPVQTTTAAAATTTTTTTTTTSSAPVNGSQEISHDERIQERIADHFRSTRLRQHILTRFSGYTEEQRNAMIQMAEMGFWDVSLNCRLLQKNRYDVSRAVEELFNTMTTDDGPYRNGNHPARPNTFNPYIAEFD